MLPRDPAISTPADAPHQAARLLGAPPPRHRVLGYREALLLTSTFWSTGRVHSAEAAPPGAAPSSVDPAPPVRLTAAELLHRACAAGATGAALRPIIRIRRQDPLHREAQAAAPASPPASASAHHGPTQDHAPPLHAAPPAAPRAPATPPPPPARPAQPAQNPLHREALPRSAVPGVHPPATSREPAQPIRPTATPTRTPRQDPLHRETAPAAGPLRNGNPRGDPNAAPRCGAINRAGCPCRAPAMRGKLRCRMHGGASTGPRTVDGLERLRAARTTHGRYAAPQRTRARYVLTADRRARVRQAALRDQAHLTASIRARLHANPPELADPPLPPPGHTLSRAQHAAIVQREARALAPWKLAILIARAQSHGADIPPSMLLPLEMRFAAMPPPSFGAAIPAAAPGAHAP